MRRAAISWMVIILSACSGKAQLDLRPIADTTVQTDANHTQETSLLHDAFDDNFPNVLPDAVLDFADSPTDGPFNDVTADINFSPDSLADSLSDGALDTAPVAPVRFAIIGDFGSAGSVESKVATMVKGWKPEFIITLGDNNYPSGETSTIDDNIGQYYHEYIGNYKGKYGAGSATNKFFPSLGNHDWYSSTGAKPYLDYFTLPGNERYYDVDKGLVHLFALDSDGNEPDGRTATSIQANWLKDRLSATSASYKLVYFHHPPFSSGQHGNSTQMQWPFKPWGADLVLSGHDHTYERLAKDGLSYIVMGLSGVASRYNWVNVKPESVFRYRDNWGAILATATKKELKLEFWNITNTLIDTVVLEKTCP